ncbi:MAG: hypothetical protein A2147_03950, partial [Chloroflexi bacterium RBG_16_57_8]
MILLLSATIIYIALSSVLKRGRSSVPTVRIANIGIGDGAFLVILSVVNVMALGANWYLLNNQQTALNSPLMTVALVAAICAYLVVVVFLVRQVIRGRTSSNTSNGSMRPVFLVSSTTAKMLALSIKNIRGSGFRSIAIFFAVMGVAGFLLATTLIITGARYSLDSGLKRLGADILVVPEGAETKVETALLMGKPTQVWMPRENLQRVAGITGVEAVSPQIFLASMFDSPCCSVSEMFIVVYDPATDFTLSPWLQKNLGRKLALGEVIGGTYIFVPEGSEYIELYGYEVDLLGVMEPTGTGIDQTLFMSLETAQAMSRASRTNAMETLNVDPGAISTIMVRVTPESDPHRVAIEIQKGTDGVVSLESPKLFGAFRSQMNGLLWGFFAITIIVWAVTMLLIG